MTRSGDYFIRAQWSLIISFLFKSQTPRYDYPKHRIGYCLMGAFILILGNVERSLTFFTDEAKILSENIWRGM